MTTNQYRLADKFYSVEELSFEPIGCFYQAVTTSSDKVILLILNKDFSDIARKRINLLETALTTNPIESSDTALIDIIDIVDCREGIVLVMPYFDGRSLADYINKKGSLDISSVKKISKQLLGSLSYKHQAGFCHGFINFSTLWVQEDSQLVLLGSNIFHLLFDKTDYLSTSLSHIRIQSCINQDLASEEVKCSIYADYYSILIIIRSLILGFIATNKFVNTTDIKQTISPQSMVYLTKTFCDKSYNSFVSVKDWVNKLESSRGKYSLSKKFTLAAVASASIIFSALIMIYFVNDDSQNSAAKLMTHTSRGLIKSSSRGLPPESTNQTMELASNPKSENEDIDLTEVLDKSIELNEDNNLAKNEESVLNNKLPTEKELIQQYYNKIALNLTTNKTSDNASIQKMQLIQNTNRTEVCNSEGCKNIEFKTPKFKDIQVFDKTKQITPSPLSREDYYTYCYLSESCKLDLDKTIDSVSLELCLFDRQCDKEIYDWLSKPMEFATLEQVHGYISWLNKNKLGKFDLLSDQDWTLLAQNLEPSNNCQLRDDKGLKDFNLYPEWVKINQSFATRSPAKLLAEEQQCQIALNMYSSSESQSNGEQPNVSNKKSLVRLIKIA